MRDILPTTRGRSPSKDSSGNIKAKGYVLVGSYIDRALSARTDDRPDSQRMVSDPSKRIFDIVLVWKLD